MDEPWHRRFLAHPPPLPDRVWAWVLMGLLVLVGMVLGASVCAVLQEHAPHPATLTLQQHLNSLEQRVRLLEHR